METVSVVCVSEPMQLRLPVPCAWCHRSTIHHFHGWGILARPTSGRSRQGRARAGHALCTDQISRAAAASGLPNDHGVGNAGDHGGVVNLVCDEFGATWLGGDLWLEDCAAGATGLLRRDSHILPRQRVRAVAPRTNYVVRLLYIRHFWRIYNRNRRPWPWHHWPWF